MLVFIIICMCKYVSTIVYYEQERLTKKEEAQTMFEMSKVEKDLDDSVGQQCLEEYLEKKHKLAEERHRQERAAREAHIQRSV